MVADAGICGIGRLVVDCEVMMLPLGTMTVREGLAAEVGWWCK